MNSFLKKYRWIWLIVLVLCMIIGGFLLMPFIKKPTKKPIRTPPPEKIQPVAFRFSGQVVDKESNPIKDVSVTVWADSRNKTTITGEDGYFSVNLRHPSMNEILPVTLFKQGYSYTTYKKTNMSTYVLVKTWGGSLKGIDGF